VERLWPWVSLVISIAVLPFVGMVAIVSVITGLLALVYVRLSSRR
jgi:hypothetical protein